MFIRSQDRTILIEAKNLIITDKATIMTVQDENYYELGKYKIYNEAVAVLDDIQECIEAGACQVYDMPLKAYYLLYISKLKLGKNLTKKLYTLGIETIGDIYGYELLENYNDDLTDDEIATIKEALKKYETNDLSKK